jgi:hypothetical protein
VFVDAVGPWNFVYHDPAAYGHEIFAELRDYIEASYDLVDVIRSTRIYVRKDRLEATQRRTQLPD